MANSPQIRSAIRDWWASNPMTYGLEHGATEYLDRDGKVKQLDFTSAEFFRKADEVFYAWNAPLHRENHKFGHIFDYSRYRDRPVLEIGCGMGCMASNWAKNGASLTAIDLNPVSIRQTSRRFELEGLSGDIRQADAEALPFADASFSYVYSWGVLHHSPGIENAIAEVYRVLEPGGRVGIMLYNRNSFLFRYSVQYIEGFLNMESDFLSPLSLASRYGDGERKEGNPHTWPVTTREIQRDLMRQFKDVHIETFGTDVPWMLDHFLPSLGAKWLPRSWVQALARRYGWSLWITAEKPNI